MKRWIAVLTMMVLLLLLSGCSGSGAVCELAYNGESVSGAPEVELDDAVTVQKAWFADGENGTYTFQNKDSKALLRMLGKFSYKGEPCDCMPNYTVTVGEGETVRWGIQLSREDPYVRFNGGQTSLSAKEAASIRAIFDRCLVEENQTEQEHMQTSAKDAEFSDTDGPCGINLKEEEPAEPEAEKAEPEKYAVVTVAARETSALQALNYYTFQNEDAEALQELLLNLDYDKNFCYCIATHYIYLGEERETRYSFSFHHPCIGGPAGMVKPSLEEVAMLEGIFERQLVEEHQIPTEEAEYGAKVAHRSGEGYSFYSFLNADSERLLTLLRSYEYAPGTASAGPEYKIDIDERPFFRWGLSLSGEKATAALEGEQIAEIPAADMAEIRAILERNCIAGNTFETESSRLAVYVTGHEGEEHQHRFRNADSKGLIELLTVALCFPVEGCDCTADCQLACVEEETDSTRLRFNIAFREEGAHISGEGGHAILNAADSALVEQILERQCTGNTLVLEEQT